VRLALDTQFLDKGATMKLSKRTVLAIGTFAALLPFGVAGAEAAGLTNTGAAAASGVTTPLDRAIDLIVQQRAKARSLTPAETQVYREQLQLMYLAMPAEVRAEVQAASRNVTSEEGIAWLGDRIFGTAVDAARKQVEDERKAAQPSVAADQNQPAGMTQKLGGLDTDLVFVPTVGPCRVADTRLNITGNWPGPVAGFTGRQIWGFSNLAGYNYNDFQGGTGIAGAGNCAGTVYTGPYPVSVVATIAVVNTYSTGYLRAWNGGTTLTVGGVLGWNAGDVLSNTTVIPMDRTIAEYPGSGPYKRDFAVYNNSGTPVDVIVDVVGYFIVNKATPLECTNVTNTSTTSSAVDVLMTADACPTGYTPTGISCASSASGGNGVSVIKSFINPLGGGAPSTGVCRFQNLGGASQTYWGYLTCCRVPGR